MTSVITQHYQAGLDSRRMAFTALPGTLTVCENAHITRGGEIEQRKAFAPMYALPADTFGLTVVMGRIYVFGSEAVAGLPEGLVYQRLQRGAAVMVRLVYAEAFAGKIYAIAEFDDGAVGHFYDGTEVTAWFDGRARSSFTVGNGTNGDQVTSIKINGVEVLGAAVSWSTSSSVTAAAIISQVNSFTSTPNYTATGYENVVILAYPASGSTANGYPVLITSSGSSMVTPASTTMAGGGTASTAATYSTTDFTVTGGAATPAPIQATAQFTLISQNPPSSVSSIKVNNVEILGATINFAGSATATMAALASQINTYTSDPEYTATSSGNVLTVKAPVSAGASANGRTATLTYGGNDAVWDHLTTTFSGGVDGNQLSSVTINNVEVLGTPVVWATSNTATASAIATQVNAYASNPRYTALAANGKVTISYPSAGPQANGYAVFAHVTGSFTLDKTSTSMSGGSDASPLYQPGAYAHTLKGKMYSISGSLLHFSAINDPTHWTTEYTGAGFINLSNQASGSEELMALATYMGKLAVFSRSAVQVWIVDADQTQNTQTQVLSNTGTRAPRSVLNYGESDVFYLAESGVRSLKARDASNAAAVSDVGTMIDTMLQEDIRGQSASTVDRACAVIEPLDGRYMLAMGSTVYVYSAFPASKVSAWSTYSPGFPVTDWAYFGSKTYARSGNTIYLLGGADGTSYDDATVTVVLPYMDARKPRENKALRSINVACEGLWQIEVNSDPKNPDVWEKVAIVSGPTFTQDVTEVQGYSSHFKYRFQSIGSGYHRLGNFEWYYE